MKCCSVYIYLYDASTFIHPIGINDVHILYVDLWMVILMLFGNIQACIIYPPKKVQLNSTLKMNIFDNVYPSNKERMEGLN